MDLASRRRFSALFIALFSAALAGCSSSPATTADAPTTNPPDAPPAGGPDAPAPSPDAATAASFGCTTGSLFAGDPTFTDTSMHPSDGAGMLADPPLHYRVVVISNGQMISHDGQEIWRANLSDGKLHRIAGDDSADQALITGACAGARFANINSITLASDGSLFIVDQTANTVLKMTHPLGADCSVSHYAGTPDDMNFVDVSDPPNLGNVDGPGNMAKFRLPQRAAVDANDNIYVWDESNDSIRKIASDADHTVSTFVEAVAGGEGSLITSVVLGGNLYVYGQDHSDNLFIEAVDLTTKAKHDLVRGRGEKFGDPPGESITTTGIVTDGTGLIVFVSGQLFYVKTDGTILPPIAGIQTTSLDLEDGYDPKASHPAAELDFPIGTGLVFTGGAEAWLGIDANQDLYLSGEFEGAPFVEKIACGR